MSQFFDDQPSMHNASVPGGYSPQPAYPASVPMSVYRELAAELQANRIMLESLNNQNHQLVQHNQRLRQEIGRMVTSAMQVQQIAERYQPPSITMPDASYIEVEFEPEDYLPLTPKHVNNQHRDRQGPDLPRPDQRPDLSKRELIKEQPEGRHYRPKSYSKPRDLTGLWMVLIIFGIVITAFAAGFWIVRPFLSD